MTETLDERLTATAGSAGGLPTFDGRYVAERIAGKDGFATVYAGTDRLLHRPVAITVLTPQSTADKAATSRFYREAIDVLRLDHPNIVAAYEAGRQYDEYYFVSEFVEGKSLYEILDTSARPAKSLAFEYAAQIAGATAYARAKGVPLHVDPRTALVTADGVVKIATPFMTGPRERALRNPPAPLDKPNAEPTPAPPAARQIPPALPDATAVMMDAIANRFLRKSDPLEWGAPASRKWPVRAIVGAVLLLLLAAGGIAFAFARYAALPNYTGMSENEAREALLDDGFSVAMRSQASTMVLAHHVIEQQPPAGRWLGKGGEVVLTVSSGEPPVPVPRVVGLRVKDAKRLLGVSSLAATTTYRVNKAPAGTVLGERPTAGTHVAQTATIALAVSSGSLPGAHAAPVVARTLRPPVKARPASPRGVGARPAPTHPKTACPGGNHIVDIQGYPKGCTAAAISSSGALLHDAGTGVVVPVTSLQHPGDVLYGLMYVTPPSGSQRFIGVLSGDDTGPLIMRVQDGVFVAQNGGHAKYFSVADAPVTAPESTSPPTCAPQPWLRRTLHKVLHLHTTRC